MKVKSIVWFGVICFFAMSVLMFIFDSDPSVFVATAGGYVGILSSWLGFDIAKTRDRTLSKPAGKYESIRVSRYLFSLISIGVLLIISIVNKNADYGPVKVVLLPCFYGIGALIITAYGFNKVSTPKGPNKGQSCAEEKT